MRRWRLGELDGARSVAGRPYHEFLRAAAMSAGLYVLEAGALDAQRPHAEDEVYVVVGGRARFTSGGATIDVAPGDTIFVAAGEEHRFHDIAETLRLIVVFAPPESAGS